MLELLSITAGSLRWFEALPLQTREVLADGLEKMRNNLEEAKGFLPYNVRRKIKARRHDMVEYFTAYAVELARRDEELSLEDARAKVAEESGMTDSVIHTRWQDHHKDVKESLILGDWLLDRLLAEHDRWPHSAKEFMDMMFRLLEEAANHNSTTPPRKRRPL